MDILIIGGSRFVGPLVVNKLLKREHRVTVFNRGQIQSNYDKNIIFIKGDRNKGFKIRKHFDVVIDMCAYNGAQTKNAVNNLNFDFFIHFSTAAVYKKTETFPLTESSSLGKWPVWGNYNAGKVECEKVLENCRLKFATIRPVYILGPGNYLDRESFIYSRIRREETITLPGTGQAICQFVFAKDVAEVLTLLAEKKLSGAFNVAGDDLITLKGLVEIMAKIVGGKPKLKYNLATDGENFDPTEFPFANENFIVSCEKLKNLGIKFTPLVSGLKEDYGEYYENLS